MWIIYLAAGGVGLNLVGANHLFLLDMHWNPQLEAQACDRIYRVGQKRNVKIHKFLCEDTVESRIQDLQVKKMDLANNVLTGATLISLINVEPTLTNFEKFHPPQNKNPPSSFINFLDFSTLHSSFIRFMY